MVKMRVRKDAQGTRNLFFHPDMVKYMREVIELEDIPDEDGNFRITDGTGFWFSPLWLEPVDAAPTQTNPTESEAKPSLLALPVEEAAHPSSDFVKNASDPVNKPSHYQFSQYEPVKVIQAWDLSFCLGNVVKYIARAGRKDSSKLIEDLEKAKRYLELELEELRKV